jgi:hypothetical protein
MAFVTKLTKTPQNIQQWLAAEINPNDVIGVWESLGYRCAQNVTVESKGGPTIIRFNVVDKLYQDQRGKNSWIPYAGSYICPYLIGEIIQPRTDIVIDTNSVWQEKDLQVLDIQVLQLAPLLVITVF